MTVFAVHGVLHGFDNQCTAAPSLSYASLRTMLLLETDPIAVAGLVVAVIGVIVGVVAAVAAIYAAVYAKAAPTKEDLARVEQNTAESTRHLQRQTQRDELAARIERVPLEIWGQDPLNQDLNVYIRCPVDDALPTRISFYNEHGALFGTSAVVRTPDDNYLGVVQADVATLWFHGGTPVSVGHGRTRVIVRINLAIDGQEGYREIAASLRQTLIGTEQGNVRCYALDGAI